jgi:parvulin-like peptidyl-prolyl isomerase
MAGFKMRRVAWAGWALLLVTASSGFGQIKPAAMVNGEPISAADVEAVLAQRPAELFPLPEAQKQLIRREVLEELISQRLMKQYLARNAEPLDPAEIGKQMATLAISLKHQGKTLEQFCKETHQTENQIRSGLALMLQFTAHARKLATDEELRKYFNDNCDFFQKTTVRLSHIVIRIPVGATDSERAEVRRRFSELRGKIAAGQVSFADAAREHSQCPSAPKGGDIGVVTRKWMVDEAVARAAFALKPRQVSDIVESEFGLHLLLVTERTEGKKVEFAEVIDDVRSNYVEDMRHKVLLDLRRQARVEFPTP